MYSRESILRKRSKSYEKFDIWSEFTNFKFKTTAEADLIDNLK